MSERQRIDVWLFRARFVKTRAAASRLVVEGGVRLVHDGVPRRLEKPSVEVAPGDTLMFSRQGKLIAVEVKALGARRGPPTEARALYRELDAERLA
ncbi:MAG: S4 domain-containing protein [Hyphomonadaceae bacterium]